ncbi:unnamed protein product [Gulo gulo]|uniref:Small ribosomal subunit protein eS6 n=1 Tax=Gulo gulo TaxID=48420 RepID=A0A9X9Q0R9_GULGU|nr:unnamed protein product [Gulo gulo]
MKLNISFPVTGCQKLIEVDNEHKLCTFYEKDMATDVAADALSKEWKHGVLTHGRVLLLLSKQHSCYGPRWTGERKCNFVQGSIVHTNVSVLKLVSVKKS